MVVLGGYEFIMSEVPLKGAWFGGGAHQLLGLELLRQLEGVVVCHIMSLAISICRWGAATPPSHDEKVGGPSHHVTGTRWGRSRCPLSPHRQIEREISGWGRTSSSALSFCASWRGSLPVPGSWYGRFLMGEVPLNGPINVSYTYAVHSLAVQYGG